MKQTLAPIVISALLVATSGVASGSPKPKASKAYAVILIGESGTAKPMFTREFTVRSDAKHKIPARVGGRVLPLLLFATSTDTPGKPLWHLNITVEGGVYALSVPQGKKGMHCVRKDRPLRLDNLWVALGVSSKKSVRKACAKMDWNSLLPIE